mmetsp:Transcript_14509/g.38588  ORF Transcript_14509/g.38588 Transcript_14509/m.38588 type:complete len:207 (+) Transcript_14509:597-1217(+)
MRTPLLTTGGRWTPTGGQKRWQGVHYLRLVMLSVGKRVVAQYGRLGDAPAIWCDSGRAAPPKPGHDIRRVAHQACRSLRHCSGNTCLWPRLHGSVHRRRRSRGTGRTTRSRRECRLQGSWRRGAGCSAAAAPGSWRLDCGPLSLCSFLLVTAAARRTEERQQPLVSEPGTPARRTVLCASLRVLSRPPSKPRGCTTLHWRVHTHHA